MKLRYIIIFGVLILSPLLIYAGCRSGPESMAQNVPGWLNSIPGDERYFYAVGISGATRSVKDAWDQAIKRARAELGRTIISHVTSKDMVICSTRGQYASQVIDILSDAELNFTEVIERWHDRFGKYGPPNHYYVLVRLEKKRAETILKSLK
ncbi:MAG: LPP20 family lipoprotein [Desulfobacterales bacterium]|nr:LPP20 family lipoprotein [Desulfobacterales bacterium]